MLPYRRLGQPRNENTTVSQRISHMSYEWNFISGTLAKQEVMGSATQYRLVDDPSEYINAGPRQVALKSFRFVYRRSFWKRHNQHVSVILVPQARQELSH